jgi:hypothetical protein
LDKAVSEKTAFISYPAPNWEVMVAAKSKQNFRTLLPWTVFFFNFFFSQRDAVMEVKPGLLPRHASAHGWAQANLPAQTAVPRPMET